MTLQIWKYLSSLWHEPDTEPGPLVRPEMGDRRAGEDDRAARGR